MSLVSNLQLLKVDNSVEQFGKTYDELRSGIGSFLGRFEVPSYRGQREFKSVEFEDLLLSADAFFSSLKTILEAMTEAQDILDNWDEGTPEDSEYAQALGEVIMAKRLFLSTVKAYDRLENLRYHMAMSERDAVTRTSAYNPVSLQRSSNLRLEFFRANSRRPDGQDLPIQHPRSVQPYYTNTTNRLMDISDLAFKPRKVPLGLI
jgi:hypothetical protein